MTTAIDPVVLHFMVSGIPETTRAFETIDQKLLRMEKQVQDASRKGSRSRVKTAEDEAKAREKAGAKLAKALDRQERQIGRDAEREAKARERSVEATSKVAAREAKASADTQIDEQRRTTRELEREEERKMRIRIRSSEMAGRIAAKEAQDEIRGRQRALRTWGQRGHAVGSSVVGSVGRIIGGAGAVAGATLGIGGGFLLADAAKKELDSERTAALLVNAVTTGSAPPKGASVNEILGQASQVSRSLNIDRNTLLQGTLEYSRKARGGDFAGAMANMAFFGKMAKVTGADITDIAGAAGTLQSQNPKLDAKGMQEMLLDVYAQGKAGSMSMVDVASQIGILGSTRSAYSGDAATNQRKLLALGQLAAPEGTIEEAGTFIKNMSAEAGAHRKSTKGMVGLEQMGVKFNQYGQMESPEQMVSSVMAATKGDITKIEKIFGLRGTALFRSLQPAYVNAGGGAAGIAAVQAKMASVTGATMTTESLDQQFEQVMSTPAQKFGTALNNITETLENKLAPVMQRLADGALPNLIDKLDAVITAAADFADWMTDSWPHAFEGVGLIVSAAITKDLVGAGIGMAVKATLTSLITTVFGSLSAGSVAPPAAGAVVAGAGAAGATSGAAGAAGTVMGATATLSGAALIGVSGLGGAIGATLSDHKHREALSGSLMGSSPTQLGTGNAFDAQQGAAIRAVDAIITWLDSLAHKVKSTTNAIPSASGAHPSNPSLNVPIQQRPTE